MMTHRLPVVIWASLSLLAVALLVPSWLAQYRDYSSVRDTYQRVAAQIRSCDDLQIRVPTCRLSYASVNGQKEVQIEYTGFSEPVIGETVTLFISPDGRDIRKALPTVELGIVSGLLALSSVSALAGLVVLGTSIRQTALRGRDQAQGGAPQI